MPRSSKRVMLEHADDEATRTRARVLRALQARFLGDPESFAVFCEGFTEELNRLRREHRAKMAAAPRELAAINRRSKEILELLLQGFRDNAWKVELAQIEQRRAELEAAIAASETEPVLPTIHPHMATVYRQKVEQLAAALAHENEELREAARSGLRGFIDEIVIPPGDALLVVRGDLGRMLATVAGKRDGSMLAAVVESGCGDVQPTLSAALATCGVKRFAKRNIRLSAIFDLYNKSNRFNESTDRVALAAVDSGTAVLARLRDNRRDSTSNPDCARHSASGSPTRGRCSCTTTEPCSMFRPHAKAISPVLAGVNSMTTGTFKGSARLKFNDGNTTSVPHVLSVVLTRVICGGVSARSLTLAGS
jgi:hypothetical protein